jgi:hypothetical protein
LAAAQLASIDAAAGDAGGSETSES